MRHPILAMILAVLMLANLALAQSNKITLVNQTGYDIKALYIAPSSDEEFDKSDELLHGANFGNGKQFEMTYTGHAPAWDLLVTWKDGSGDSEWSKLKLVPGGTYGIVYNKETDATTIKKL